MSSYWTAKRNRNGKAVARILLAAAALVGGAAGALSQSPVKIVFGENSPGTIHTPLYVADYEGMFKKAGIDVEVVVLQGGVATTMAALASGSIDVMTASATDLINFTAKQVIVGKMVGQMQDAAFDIVVSKDIKSMEQIAGKTVGVSALNAGDHLYINAILKKFNVDTKDITFMASGNPINRLSSLTANAVQAIAVSNSQRITSEKVGSILLGSDQSPIRVPNSSIFAADRVLKTPAQKDAMKIFLKVLGEASKWALDNPEKAAVDCAKGSGATIDQCLATFKAVADKSVTGPYTWSSTYAMDVVGTKAALDMVSDFEPKAKKLKFEDVADASYTGPNP